MIALTLNWNIVAEIATVSFGCLLLVTIIFATGCLLASKNKLSKTIGIILAILLLMAYFQGLYYIISLYP